MAGYNIFPGVDDSYNFPPEVRGQLALSDELNTRFLTKSAVSVRGVYKKFVNLNLLFSDTTLGDGDIAGVGRYDFTNNQTHVGSLWMRINGALIPIADLLVESSVGIGDVGNQIVNVVNSYPGRATIPTGTKLKGTNGQVFVWTPSSSWGIWDLPGDWASSAFNLQTDVGYDSGSGINSVAVRGGVLTWNFAFYSNNVRGNNNAWGNFNQPYAPRDGSVAHLLAKAYSSTNGYNMCGLSVRSDGTIIQGIPYTGGFPSNAIEGSASWRMV